MLIKCCKNSLNPINERRAKRLKRNTGQMLAIIASPNKASLLAEKSFSIPLILKEILSYLPRCELQSTALVSKHWNLISREILRSKESSLATLKVGGCDSLRKISYLFEDSENVPFNSLSLKIVSITGCTCPKDNASKLAETAQNLLVNMNIKYLSLYCDRANECCIAIAFLKEVLTTRAESLEGLTVHGTPEKVTNFSEIIGQNLGTFPNLRFLRFPSWDSDNDLLMHYPRKPVPNTIVQELVEASPKLQKIYGYFKTEFLLPLKKPGIFQEFKFQPTVDSLSPILDFARTSPKLKGLEFSTRLPNGSKSKIFHEWSELEVKQVVQALKLLLKSSEDSLESLSADNLDLLLMTYKWKITGLKSVRKLNLSEVNSPMYDLGGYRTLHKLEWSTHFPNLREVRLGETCTESYDQHFYIHGSVLDSSLQYTCGTVRKVVLGTDLLRGPDALPNMSLMRSLFPNAKELHVGLPQQSLPLFCYLFPHWSDLETLVCRFYSRDSFFNVDEFFLGVSKEEVFHLLKQITEVGSLELTPERNCLSDFPNLKNLVIHLKHDFCCKLKCDCDDKTVHTPNAVFVSRLTASCIFARMPSLKVEVHRRMCQKQCNLELKHLKPFATLIEHEDDGFH